MSHTLSVDYPETIPDTLHMSRAKVEREARLAMAAIFFETGRLSSGQAAGLIGMATRRPGVDAGVAGRHPALDGGRVGEMIYWSCLLPVGTC